MTGFSYHLLTFLSFCKDSYDYGQNCIVTKFKNLEDIVLQGTFTEVHGYDLTNQVKCTLRNNTSLLKLLFLYVVKCWLKQDITKYTCLQHFNFDDFEDNLLFEVVYYNYMRENKRYLTRQSGLTRENILKHITMAIPSKFLCATISDKVNCTALVNEHLASFNYSNGITVEDLCILYNINHPYRHPVETYDCYLKLIHDSTLEEKIFQSQEIINLVDDL
jgi:hypothetical protein